MSDKFTPEWIAEQRAIQNGHSIAAWNIECMNYYAAALDEIEGLQAQLAAANQDAERLAEAIHTSCPFCQANWAFSSDLRGYHYNPVTGVTVRCEMSVGLRAALEAYEARKESGA